MKEWPETRPVIGHAKLRRPFVSVSVHGWHRGRESGARSRSLQLARLNTKVKILGEQLTKDGVHRGVASRMSRAVNGTADAEYM